MELTKDMKTCLFFTGINHLFNLLNETLQNLGYKKNFIFISDYNSEQLFLRWTNLLDSFNLKRYERIKFIKQEELCKITLNENDILINVGTRSIKLEQPVIDCYDIFENKNRINEIIQNYEYIINSYGLINLHDLYKEL